MHHSLLMLLLHSTPASIDGRQCDLLRLHSRWAFALRHIDMVSRCRLEEDGHQILCRLIIDLEHKLAATSKTSAQEGRKHAGPHRRRNRRFRSCSRLMRTRRRSPHHGSRRLPLLLSSVHRPCSAQSKGVTAHRQKVVTMQSQSRLRCRCHRAPASREVA
jgi:hypothetical protein